MVPVNENQLKFISKLQNERKDVPEFTGTTAHEAVEFIYKYKNNPPINKGDGHFQQTTFIYDKSDIFPSRMHSKEVRMYISGDMLYKTERVEGSTYKTEAIISREVFQEMYNQWIAPMLEEKANDDSSRE